jgi:hypothetical protein
MMSCSWFVTKTKFVEHKIPDKKDTKTISVDQKDAIELLDWRRVFTTISVENTLIVNLL